MNDLNAFPPRLLNLFLVADSRVHSLNYSSLDPLGNTIQSSDTCPLSVGDLQLKSVPGVRTHIPNCLLYSPSCMFNKLKCNKAKSEISPK